MFIYKCILCAQNDNLICLNIKNQISFFVINLYFCCINTMVIFVWKQRLWREREMHIKIISVFIRSYSTIWNRMTMKNCNLNLNTAFKFLKHKLFDGYPYGESIFASRIMCKQNGFGLCLSSSVPLHVYIFPWFAHCTHTHTHTYYTYTSIDT